MKKIGFIGLLLYFLGIKKKSLLIFNLRGGLGNQLFQIVGVSSHSKSQNLDILFCDSDVRMNQRDRDGAVSLEFDILRLFPKEVMVYRPTWVTAHLVRFIKKIEFLSEHLKSIDLDQEKISPDIRITLAKGYLQDINHVLEAQESTLTQIFEVSTEIMADPQSCAMHIRGGDALLHSEMILSESYYHRALIALGAKADQPIDVFTDDHLYAKKICSSINQYSFNFVEINKQIPPAKLLIQLSSYKRIICSKSTLCWWAAYLSQLRDTNAMIVSPWSDKLRAKGWIHLY